MQKKIIKLKKENKQARKNRIRARIKGAASRPRLCIFKSNQHIYAQIINDESSKTLAAASDLEIKGHAFQQTGKKGAMMEKAKSVGAMIAKKAKEHKIETVVFDRGGNKYHGIIKALADSAREGGLKF